MVCSNWFKLTYFALFCTSKIQIKIYILDDNMKKERGLKGLCNYVRKSFPSYSLKLVTKPQNA